MNYAQILGAALNQGAFGDLEAHYLHRARREDSVREIVGRDLLIWEDLALAAAIGKIDVQHFTPSVLTLNSAEGWRQHRWIFREGERISRDCVITDQRIGGAELSSRAAAVGELYPTQLPLGELRSGRGQLAAGDSAWYASDRQDLLDALHRIWNGRRFDQISRVYAPQARWSGPGGVAGGQLEARDWILHLLARLPDATLLFDCVETEENRVALLWRLFAHLGMARVRVMGSSLLTLDEERRIQTDETLIDELALAATPYRRLLVINR